MANKKKEPSKAQKEKKEQAQVVANAKEQLEVITQKFIDNPEPFFEDRKKEIANAIVQYGNLQQEDMENGVLTKKDYSLKLVNALCKPLIPMCAWQSTTAKQHTAMTLKLTSDFYWQEIVEPLNENSVFIPNIHHLYSLLDISHNTFNQYRMNGDELMRETCEKIKDKFVGYYQTRGMEKAVSEIMAMFVLKTTFQQRESDVPQVNVQVNNISANEKITRMAKQLGYDVWKED